MTRWWRSAMLDALAIVLPVECAGCGVADRALCLACRAALACEPTSSLLDGVPLTSALDYDGVVRSMILSLKEHGRTDVRRSLAVPLDTALRRAADGAGPVTLCTIPRSSAGWRRRGYDPVSLLLATARLRAPRLLAWAGSTRAQKGLTEREREGNRIGMLRARRSLAGVRVLIVDDVVTTGATVREAIRAVRAAGGEVVAVVALARRPRFLPRATASVTFP